ncbi:MAG: inositol monophosphatase [Clostridiales bacterium]|nr:inositol monophosphatase [Clostridiales bacterium]
MRDGLKEIVNHAGHIILKAGSDIIPKMKTNARDIMTQYDLMVEEYLKYSLHEILPEAGFVGEETHGDMSKEGYIWLVDPIDGTTNFSRNYLFSCTSVALFHNGKLIEGYVYNPYLNEFFWAVKGKGSFLNDRQISVSDRDFSSALVLFGTSPYLPEKFSETLHIAGKCLNECIDLRRSGSAVLDICYVAAGRGDVFYESVLSPWDYAAAAMILMEAGGEICDFDGKTLSFFERSSIIAGNAKTIKRMKQIVDESRREIISKK